MPCCAFALFVIAHIAAFLAMIGRALGFAGPPDDVPPFNPATAWQLHAVSAVAPARHRGPRRLAPALVLIALLEIGVVTTGVAWLASDEHAPGATADTLWCGSRPSVVEVASLGDR